MNNRSTSKLLGVCCALMLLAYCVDEPAAVRAQTEESPLTVTATSELVNGEPLLHVSIKNNGKSPVTLHATSLPWLSLTAMQLTAVEDTYEATVLSHAVPAWEAGPDTFVLRPGAFIAGRVRLSDHFPSIQGTLRKTGVVVYWNMRVSPLDAPQSARFFGGVAIARVKE